MKKNTKLCPVCKQVKSTDEFGTMRTSKGVEKPKTYCRLCTSQIARNWYYTNQEKARARMMAYSQKWRETDRSSVEQNSPRGRKRRVMVNGCYSCSRCHQLLPPGAFYASHTSPMRVTSDCRMCRKERLRYRYNTDPELRARLLARNALYRAKDAPHTH